MGNEGISGRGGGSVGPAIELPADVVAEIESLRDGLRQGRKGWSAEQDAYLLAAWPTKNHEAVADAFRTRYGWGSDRTLGRRYRKLTKGAT